MTERLTRNEPYCPDPMQGVHTCDRFAPMERRLRQCSMCRLDADPFASPEDDAKLRKDPHMTDHDITCPGCGKPVALRQADAIRVWHRGRVFTIWSGEGAVTCDRLVKKRQRADGTQIWGECGVSTPLLVDACAPVSV